MSEQPVTMEILAPVRRKVGVEELLATLRGPSGLEPFDTRTLDFCQAFSRALFQLPDGRQNAERQALAYALRRAEVVRLQSEFEALKTPSTVLVPRGVALHIAPANVDTMFVHSWLFSMLAGNRNIVRISSDISPQVEGILEACRSALADADPALAASIAIVSYPHAEAAITRKLSAACDLRIIWGGDDTVRAIRALPLPPHARELTFCDRYSLAAIQAQSFLTAAPGEQRAVAQRLVSDTYAFQQAACSSPRLIVWCGTEDCCREAAASLFRQMAQAGIDRHAIPDAVRLSRLAFTHRAVLDRAVTECERFADDLVVLRLETLEGLERSHCGGGLFFQFYTGQLQAIAEYAQRKDQTLVHYGFSREELVELARAIAGRGIDRMVPIGKALQFQRYWDGYDLLQEMIRRIYLEV